MIKFEMWTSYRPPVGTQKRGHNEFYWRSTCGRWIARQGARKGTMILTDKAKDAVHVVDGGMPEVEAFASLQADKRP